MKDSLGEEHYCSKIHISLFKKVLNPFYRQPPISQPKTFWFLFYNFPKTLISPINKKGHIMRSPLYDFIHTFKTSVDAWLAFQVCAQEPLLCIVLNYSFFFLVSQDFQTCLWTNINYDRRKSLLQKLVFCYYWNILLDFDLI